MDNEVICIHRTVKSYVRSIRPKVRVSNINPPIKNNIGAYLECFRTKFLKALFLYLTSTFFMLIGVIAIKLPLLKKEN